MRSPAQAQPLALAGTSKPKSATPRARIARSYAWRSRQFPTRYHARMHVRVVALAIGLAGCKGEPTDDLPLDKVEHAKLLKEQKQVNAGETVGERLRTPKVVLDAKDVTINGRKVAARS